MRKKMRKPWSKALSGDSAENALCIRLNDRGVGAALIKDL